MHEALTSLLLSHAPLTALVGDRVHWGALPSGVTGAPYVILQEVRGEEGYHSKGSDGLNRSRVQIDSRAETSADALAVQRLIGALLSGYRGTVAATEVQGIFSDGVRDLTDLDAKDDVRLFRRSQDFFIHWRKD